MDRSDIEKQRKIGKMLLIVDIIHYENDRAVKSGFSFVDMDRMSGWTSLTTEELGNIRDACASLDRFNLSSSAAWAYEKDISSENAYYFLVSTYQRMGSIAVERMITNRIHEYCETRELENYKRYCDSHSEYPVDGRLSNPEEFEKIIRHYANHFTETVNEFVKMGFDWVIILRMLWFELPKSLFDILKEKISSQKAKE